MEFRELVLAILITCVCSQEPTRFHESLSPAEQMHYFGSENVPNYEFTSPQRVERRKRREAGDESGDQLEYVIHAFGDRLQLLLEKNTNLITPGCTVHRYKGNGSKEVVPCSTQETDCFYTGRTSNDSDTWVAATVCGGLHGVIGMGEKTLMIQPIREQHMSRAKRETRMENPHIIYQHQQQKRSCDSEGHIDSGSAALNVMRRRRRRQTAPRRYIETAVVADKTVYEFHGQETEAVIKTIMNIAAQRLLDPSLGTQLYLALNKIVILEEDEADLEIVADSESTLTNLCHWVTTWNPAEDSNPEHVDYTLLLTKTDLTFKGNLANSGLAKMGMCGKSGGCSVNEDAGLAGGLTVAHETGHVLGMNHDSDNNECANGVNIMSTSASTGPTAFKWSTCSGNYVKAAISASRLTCLDDEPAGSAIKSYEVTVQPGSLYSATQQCRLMIGHNAEVCSGIHAKNEDVCGGLVCRPKPDTGVNGCIIYATPRMEGTDCSDHDVASNRSWCVQGQCLPMGPGSPEPRNGGWSDWETNFNECSRTCGGGVRIKHRFCTNPEPMYGGLGCEGSDVKGELCNVQPCTTTETEFVAEQCAATDDKPIQGNLYHWVPNTGAMGDDSCLMNCHAEGTSWVAKRGINVDGTQCNAREPTPFSRCVAGKCRLFGCDGHVDSGLDFDTCGVCNGKGSTCKKLSGNFSAGTAKVFNTFVTIPMGATGITITQGNIYCFLNVKINGQELFDTVVRRVSGTHHVGGETIKYQTKPEILEIIGPVKASVEAQVYRKYGPPYVGVDPEVYYEYHVSNTSHTGEFMWKTKTGVCSVSCGTGIQTPKITCEGPTGTAEDYNCNIKDKPAEIPQECNTHACPARWRSSEWTTCSVSCAGGQRHREVHCVEDNRNVETVLSEQMCHGQAKPATTSVCGTDLCPGVWKAGEWSSCSTSCARGLKTREVKCYESQSSITLFADDRCVTEDKPTDTEACLVKPCRVDLMGDACTDVKANCFQSYGDQICTNEYKGWAYVNCMKSCGVCVENPSDYDPNCKNVISNCEAYGASFCTSTDYAAWAKKNCQKHCGLCEVTVTTTPAPDPNCMDTVNCKSYEDGMCTLYASWAKTHCKQFCNMCEEEEAEKPDIVQDLCKDDTDCEAFGSGACSVTTFAQKHCPKFCGLCQACDDVKDNCAAYGTSMCTDYYPWALKNCQGFCGLCDVTSRKKRSADMLAPPPLIELVPDVPTKVHVPVDGEVEDAPIRFDDDFMNDVVEDDDVMVDVDMDIPPPPFIGDELVPDIPTMVHVPSDDDVEDTPIRLDDDVIDDVAVGDDAVEDVDMKIPPIIGNEENMFDMVPKKPVCNTVRTAESGTVDVFGKLEPGVMCQQTIALPLGNRVLLKFKNMDVDCGSGDVFTIIDGITGAEIPVCNSLLQNEWLSSGSIVSLQFMAGKEGHGYAFNYETFPLNQTLPECSHQFTAARDRFSVFKFPMLAGDSDETCEVYIIATPGQIVQMVFTDFKMTGGAELCEKDTGVLVQDLEGGEEDEFCGELSPFIWESNGSRVRLVYRQSNVVDGFTVSYNVRTP